MAGRVIALLLLIAVLAVGGVVWFDYLNIIDAKTVLAPIYQHIPFIGKQGRTHPATEPDEILSLDAERLAVRLEAMELRNMEMDAFQWNLNSRYNEIERMAEGLDERKKALDEQENSLKAQAADAENKDNNVDRNARNLVGMPPQQAVAILAEMDDQDVIDILRKTEDNARAAGTNSIVSYWLSLMDPKRAAELQRKMAGRPSTL